MIEIANIGTFQNYTVQVYSNQSEEHFHLIKEEEYEARVSLATYEVIDYKWQKSKKAVVTNKDMKKLKEWLDQPNTKNQEVTNAWALQFAWNLLNS